MSQAAHLTPRERQIARMIMAARPVKEIAYELGLSPNTTAQYLHNLYTKLGIHTRAELALWAFKRGLYRDEDAA